MALTLLLSGCGSSDEGKAVDGKAEGYIGDVLVTRWFDWTVNDAYLCDQYEDKEALSGYKLLAVNITVTNTTKKSIPMYDTDFRVFWTDEDFAVPLTSYDDTLAYEGMLEKEYSVGINSSVTGDLLFEVPEDQVDFRIVFQEYFENETTGDEFVIYFTPEQK